MKSAANPADVGIETRHKKTCPQPDGASCSCKPSYRGTVYDRSSRRTRRGPWSPSRADARGWRIDALAKVQQGIFAGATTQSLREVGEQWFDGVRAGTIRNRGGQTYKPSVVRSYESSFALHVVPRLGGMSLAKLQRRDVQGLIDRLMATLDDNTVRNAVSPLRAICRYALSRDLIVINPCGNLDVPKGQGRRFAASQDGRRETIPTPEEADALIAALPDPGDRAIWTTAFYAGLRRGELRGLYLNDFDLAAKTITVPRSWDALDGEIAPKSRMSARTIPVTTKLEAILAGYLDQHDGREFAFPGYGRWGRDYGPFSADALLKRSRKFWLSAGLEPIELHEARHTFASLMINAGIPIPNVSRHMGHTSVSITERVYFHLLPDAHRDDRAAMDAYFGDTP